MSVGRSAPLWRSTSTLTLSMPTPVETTTPAHDFCPGHGVKVRVSFASQGVLQRPSFIRPSMTSTSPDSDVYNPNETNNAVQRMSRTSKTEYFILEWTFCLISMWPEVMYLKSLHVTFDLQWLMVRSYAETPFHVSPRSASRWTTECWMWPFKAVMVLFICTWLWAK